MLAKWSFSVPGCQKRRPGDGSRRRIKTPLMTHLTMVSAWSEAFVVMVQTAAADQPRCPTPGSRGTAPATRTRCGWCRGSHPRSAAPVAAGLHRLDRGDKGPLRIRQVQGRGRARNWIILHTSLLDPLQALITLEISRTFPTLSKLDSSLSVKLRPTSRSLIGTRPGAFHRSIMAYRG